VPPGYSQGKAEQNVHHWPLPLLNLHSVSISAEAPVTEHFIRPLLSEYYLLNTICIFMQMIDDPIIFISAPMRMGFPLTDL